MASPAQPTLSELWDSCAAVELPGPAGTEVMMTVKLEDGRDSGLAGSSFRMLVPVAPEQWLKIAARRIRGSAALQDHYDRAEALVLTADHPQTAYCGGRQAGWCGLVLADSSPQLSCRRVSASPATWSLHIFLPGTGRLRRSWA